MRQLVTVFRGEVASIGGTVSSFLIMNRVLMRFKVAGSLPGNLTGSLPLLDARLLIAATIVNVVTLVIGGLSEKHGGRECGEHNGESKIPGKVGHIFLDTDL